mmetsp:Transcript_102597/g.289904  ORF Transcript_102597/g.289904 Transcript_102597/m.289904 type:complete len:362 (+) Transcript_102597:1083-2168(+)
MLDVLFVMSGAKVHSSMRSSSCCASCLRSSHTRRDVDGADKRGATSTLALRICLQFRCRCMFVRGLKEHSATSSSAHRWRNCSICCDRRRCQSSLRRENAENPESKLWLLHEVSSNFFSPLQMRFEGQGANELDATGEKDWPCDSLKKLPCKVSGESHGWLPRNSASAEATSRSRALSTPTCIHSPCFRGHSSSPCDESMRIFCASSVASLSVRSWGIPAGHGCCTRGCSGCPWNEGSMSPRELSGDVPTAPGQGCKNWPSNEDSTTLRWPGHASTERRGPHASLAEERHSTNGGGSRERRSMAPASCSVSTLGRSAMLSAAGVVHDAPASELAKTSRPAPCCSAQTEGISIAAGASQLFA